MTGSVRKRCSCTDQPCPRLKDRRHGTWQWATRISTTDTDGRQLCRAGYASRADAQAALDRVKQLVGLAHGDDRLRRKIGDLIAERTRYGGDDLPTVDEVRRRLGAGLDPAAPSMTVGEWLTEWLSGKRGLRDGTRDGYFAAIECWLRPHLGDITLDRLRAEHVAGLLDYWTTRNVEIAAARTEGRLVQADPLDQRRRVAVVNITSQRKVLKILGTALNAAVRRRLLDRNPLDLLELPRGTRQPLLVWTPEQVVAFLSSTTDDRLHALWMIALTAGLRRGELLGLRWADLDLDNGRLAVTRAKTDAGQRTVSLTSEVVAALRDHRKRQLRERLAAHGAYDTADDLVFAQEDGSTIPAHRVTFTFQRLARDAGLPVMRFHGTRHTAATMMLIAQVDTRIVSDQLGHSSTRVTTDTYQHVRHELRDAAAARVGELLRGTADAGS